MLHTATGLQIKEFLDSWPEEWWIDDVDEDIELWDEQDAWLLKPDKEYKLIKFGYVYHDFNKRRTFQEQFELWFERQNEKAVIVIKCKKEQRDAVLQFLADSNFSELEVISQ